MHCEICGKKIVGKPFKVVVEGSEITVCSDCKQFGVEKPTTVSQPGVVKVMLKKRRSVSKIEFTEELVENYNLIIKREREKRGWSQEKLAKMIQEKESLIKKIENAEIVPEPEVVEKLERVLNVKLRERVPDVKLELKRASQTLTLGDVVIVKKKKK